MIMAPAAAMTAAAASAAAARSAAVFGGRRAPGFEGLGPVVYDSQQKPLPRGSVAWVSNELQEPSLLIGWGGYSVR